MATGRIGTTPVLQVRWSKAPSAGTTSLSGLDDNSVSLVYSVGYEAVYRNGVLLSRTNDYTATDGTTITLIDATIAGDIIEVFANQTIPLADTYSQTVANGKFINNTLTTTTGDIIYASAANTPARLGIGTAGQVLKVNSGATAPEWGAGALTLINTTSFSAVGSQSFNNVFSSTYTNYRIYLSTYATGDSLMTWRFRASGSDNSTANYYFSVWGAAASTGTLSSDNNGSGATNIQIGSNNNTNQRQYVVLDIHNPHQTTATKGITYNYVRSRTGIFGGTGYGLLDVTGTAFDGFTLTGGTITGTASIYGWSV